MPDVLVISNPSCGDRTAPQFIATYVVPLLNEKSITYEIKTTEAAGHAGDIALDFLRAHSDSDEPLTIIIGGGDGTAHEVVNALVYKLLDVPRRSLVRFVLLPLGTANALYNAFFPPNSDVEPSSVLSGVSTDVHGKLKSLDSFLSSAEDGLRPLTWNETRFQSPNSSEPVPKSIISIVVTSTSLHAAILDTAEHLRDEFKGIDRFKEAASRNITKWYNARIKLVPSSSTGVQQYDPNTDAFLTVEEADAAFDGPFAYFLSTVNVDGLEPAFVIMPLTILKPPPAGTMDVVIVRPIRDPSCRPSSSDSGKVFAAKAGRIMQEAYNNGSHVRLKYDHDGSIVFEGTGPAVVEYYRCAGWEWTPNDSDENARLVCADGTILHIPTSGKATCTVTGGEGAERISVWV